MLREVLWREKSYTGQELISIQKKEENLRVKNEDEVKISILIFLIH
jgi:hypothetical protein